MAAKNIFFNLQKKNCLFIGILIPLSFLIALNTSMTPKNCVLSDVDGDNTFGIPLNAESKALLKQVSVTLACRLLRMNDNTDETVLTEY